MAECNDLTAIRLIESGIVIETPICNAYRLVEAGIAVPVPKAETPKRLCDRIACKGADDRGDDT